jgi:anti-sigma factor RsiW
MKTGRLDMNCEEFEIVGLDSQRDGSMSDDSRQRAMQHARVCGRCAALGASWAAAQAELAALAESSRMLRVPARVEARVLQQFRLRHQPRQERRFVQLSTWGLAAAALIVCTFGVWDWHKWRQGSLGGNITASPVAALDAVSDHPRRSSTTNAPITDDSEFLMAGNESNGGNDFTQLPGSSLQDVEDGAIVRVRMERASLAAFGLPVNEDEASDWIQVDVLVGIDGSAQAVRLRE